jgi:pimeloyl-ACP methyl ester carboxylesterase
MLCFERVRSVLVLSALLASAPRAVASDVIPRQVVAPPADIANGVVRLPDPASTPTISRASLLPVRFEPRPDGVWVAHFELAVEREGGWSLALLSPAAANWTVLAAPRGTRLRPIDEAFALERRVAPVGDEMPGWVIDRRDLRGAPAGEWIVRVEAQRASDVVEGYLLSTATGEVRAEAYVTTQRLVRGEPIAVAARASGAEMQLVTRAKLVVEGSGEVLELAMHDDGQHGDDAPGDGLFGAFVPSALTGSIAARAELRGLTRASQTFQRTSQLAFTVHEPLLVLDGSANATRTSETKWRIAVGAAPLGAARRVQLSAEVWGRASGSEAPLCWLSKMLEPQLDGALWKLELEFDERWLDLAGADGTLELRNVRVQDPDTFAVLASLDALAVNAPELARRAAGPPPSNLASSTTSLLTALGVPVGPYPSFGDVPIRPALMLVHGYCSSGTIWPPAQFTQPKLEFLDPNANRTHDQFAQLLAARAQTAQLSSFGIVGHSQGGPAALHLLTYYTSGLDLASGGRRIQSVASPYQGTPLASLGSFACGVNDNMTPAGAATWLAGIPTWARAEVSYWTTSNSGSACNFFTGLLLADPEDGTVEQFRGQLPGGNNMGHVVGWCHTTGMSNPANYTDATRNQAMNTAAAR